MMMRVLEAMPSPEIFQFQIQGGQGEVAFQFQFQGSQASQGEVASPGEIALGLGRFLDILALSQICFCFPHILHNQMVDNAG